MADPPTLQLVKALKQVLLERQHLGFLRQSGHIITQRGQRNGAAVTAACLVRLPILPASLLAEATTPVSPLLCAGGSRVRWPCRAPTLLQFFWKANFMVYLSITLFEGKYDS